MAFVFPEYPPNWNEIRHNVYQRDQYTCQRCSVRGGKYGDAELHCAHILSLSKGGNNEYSNLETICRDCHEDEHPHLKNARLAKEKKRAGYFLK